MVDLVRADGTSLLAGATHISSKIISGFDKWTSCRHVFVFQDRTYLDTVIVPLLRQSEPTVNFRLGVMTTTGPQWKMPETHAVTWYETRPESNAGSYTLLLETADFLWTMDHPPKTAARVGTVAAIVAAIAAENNIQAIVAPTTQVLSMVQSFQPDTEFILERLTPRAISSKNQADFRLQMKRSKLVYGPIDFTDRQAAIHVVDVNNNKIVTDVQEEDRSHLALPEGAGGVRAVVANPYGANNQSVLSVPDAALNLGAFDNVQPPSFGYYSIPVTLGDDTSEATAVAQNRYEQEHAELYRVKFTTINVLDLEIGDYVQLVSADASFNTGASSGTSGGMSSYFITSLESIIDRGSMLTAVIAARGQLSYVAATQQEWVGGIPSTPEQLSPQFSATGAIAKPQQTGTVPLSPG